MSCLLFSKNNDFLFDTQVNLIKLTSVPFVNDVFFAKIRVLKSCSNKCQVSSKVPVSQNTVNWSKEYNFRIKISKNSLTNILEPAYLKISIRKEENGGNTYSKVGYVTINLSCFAKYQPQPIPNLVSLNNNNNEGPKFTDQKAPSTGSNNCEEIKRGYILEGYKGKKRLDNSMLVVSIKMNLVKNTMSKYIPPQEDSGNCIFIDQEDNEARHSKLEEKKEEASLPSPTAIIPKIPSANLIQESLVDKEFIAKARVNMNSFQNHSRNSSSESSSIHFNPRPLSEITIKQTAQLSHAPNSVLGAIISNIRSEDQTSSSLDKSVEKLKTTPSAASTTQFIGKPRKVRSTRNDSNDIVSKILQTVPNIQVDHCNENQCLSNQQSNDNPNSDINSLNR